MMMTSIYTLLGDGLELKLVFYNILNQIFFLLKPYFWPFRF